MRTTITHPGADELVYEIREIVALAEQIESAGQTIIWENIGDPVAKGEKVPDWIKNHVADVLKEDKTYAYSPTLGLKETREYIAKERNLEAGIQIHANDILFFNGLGDAISKIYRGLNPEARVIGPNPAYPTHSSAEAAHGRSAHITYPLDPENGWQPDLEKMEEAIVAHPEIAGILIVNPDNPTGIIFSDEVMKEIVTIAKKYKLFIISDEIYSNLVFEGEEYKKLAQYVDGVPAIAMRGVSKEFPWPGGRCGWVEFYNRDTDPDFDRYCKSLVDAKMLEVCSTTLPQRLIPIVMQDERYFPYLKKRTEHYAELANIAHGILSEVPELIVHKPQGAFYMTVVFKEGVLRSTQTLQIQNNKVKDIVLPLLKEDMELDKRFCYYLMAATGLCVVPLTSGFNATYHGFRFTVLDPDIESFTAHINLLKQNIASYLQS